MGFDVKFWGVRGSIACAGANHVKYGGNTSCIEMRVGDHHIILDAGTGLRNAGQTFLKEKSGDLFLLLTHTHWDHINGFPFFVPAYNPDWKIHVKAGHLKDKGGIQAVLSAQMDNPYFPITLKQFGSRVYFRDLEEEDFTIDENISIKTKLLSHPGKCLGYRVEYKGRAICYVTDNELFLESDEDNYNPFYVKNLIQFVHGADALITDCTYTDEEYTSKVGWGHSCISQVVDMAHRAEVKALYMFHHDPDHSDDHIDSKLKTASKLLQNKKSKTKVLAPGEGQSFKI